MFQSNRIFGHEEQYSAASQHYSAASMIDQLTIMVEMPARFEGEAVSSRAVMIALLWQQYGLDLLHPEFSRWLERNAPDVKYAVAQNSANNGVNAGLRVGADGMVKVELPLDFDQRLREVSSEYMRWQMEPRTQQMRPQTQQARPQTQQMKPQMRQVEPQMRQMRPQMQQVEAEMRRTKPQMQQMRPRPQMQQVEPQMRQVELQMRQTKPQMQQVEPRTQQMRPQMQQMRPKVQQIRPEMEQEDQIATIVYLDKSEVNPKMDYYELAYVC
jgi:hypothetical protein